MDEDLARQLSCIIRVGVISSTNPEMHTCRVAFPECRTGSYELPILERNALNNADAQMYDVGESVLCIFLPDGPEDGFIIGAFYAEPNYPPTRSQDERRVVFKDDTSLTYNRKTHEFDFTDGSTHIHADRENISMECPKSLSLKCKDFSLSAGSSVKIAAGTTIDITAGGAITVNGKTLALN